MNTKSGLPLGRSGRGSADRRRDGGEPSKLDNLVRDLAEQKKRADVVLAELEEIAAAQHAVIAEAEDALETLRVELELLRASREGGLLQ